MSGKQLHDHLVDLVKNHSLNGTGISMADVPRLVREGNFELLAREGDGVCAHAVSNDEDWIWQQALDGVNKDRSRWNLGSYGNIAMLIVNGLKNPRRKDVANALKTKLISAF